MNQPLPSYPDYKPAGLPWLAEVPAHWDVTRLKNLFIEVDCRSGTGNEPLLSLSKSRGLIRQNELSDKLFSVADLSNYKVCEPGQIVMNRMQAWNGMFAKASEIGLVSPDYSVLKSTTDADISFLLYLLKSPLLVARFVGESKGLGTGFNRLYFDRFGAIYAQLPPLPEQQCIVAFLDGKTRQIARLLRNKRQLIKLLTEQKQALIHRAVTQGLDVDAPRKESGIEGVGEVPAHWVVLANRHLFRETTRKYTGKETVQLSLSQRQGLIESDQMEERSLQTASFDHFKHVIPNDLVLNRFKAHLGVFFSSTKRGIVTFHYGVFQPKRQLRSKYYELLYHTQPYCTIYAGVSNGMTVGLQNLSNLNFYKIKTLLPPIEEQDAILHFAETHTVEISATILRVEREIALIQEYRTRLIADVVTGLVDVRQLADAASSGELPAENELDLEDEEEFIEETAETNE